MLANLVAELAALGRAEPGDLYPDYMHDPMAVRRPNSG